MQGSSSAAGKTPREVGVICHNWYLDVAMRCSVGQCPMKKPVLALGDAYNWLTPSGWSAKLIEWGMGHML
jgi:hypothetical protein